MFQHFTQELLGFRLVKTQLVGTSNVGDSVTVIRCNSVDLWLDDGFVDGWSTAIIEHFFWGGRGELTQFCKQDRYVCSEVFLLGAVFDVLL